jgi:hypothetical protein
MSDPKTCGNCMNYIPCDTGIEQIRKTQRIFINKGKCLVNGKRMNPLLVGCVMWK